MGDKRASQTVTEVEAGGNGGLVDTRVLEETEEKNVMFDLVKTGHRV